MIHLNRQNGRERLRRLFKWRKSNDFVEVLNIQNSMIVINDSREEVKL